MNYSEYTEAKDKIKTLNRSLGQLRTNLIWNYERIIVAEQEKAKLEIRAVHYEKYRLANDERFNELLWAER